MTVQSQPRVAIASVGIGRIQRGYERYFSGIFTALKDDFDITLYKSAGPRSFREKAPRLVAPAMAVARLLPVGKSGAGYRSYKQDCLAFGLTLLPDLLSGGIDVVHVIDKPLAAVLLRLRQVFRFGARIIFSDGGLLPPQYYPRVDHVHHTAKAHFDEALAFGIPGDHMTMVPCGIDSQRFAASADREELRRNHGISSGTFMILAVAAVNRAHKRVDHIIEEAGQLEGDILLWIDGRPEDPALLDLARQKLGARCRITHVPSEQVVQLYQMADVFVHAALGEGFGLAICEAAASGLKVLAHDSPHFRWLVGDRDCLVDMSVPGPLAGRLRQLARSPRQPDGAGRLAKSIRDRFDWQVLAPLYRDMYRRVAAS